MLHLLTTLPKVTVTVTDNKNGTHNIVVIANQNKSPYVATFNPEQCATIEAEIAEYLSAAAAVITQSNLTDAKKGLTQGQANSSETNKLKVPNHPPAAESADDDDDADAGDILAQFKNA